MNSSDHFSLSVFTDTTKKACTCSAISIFIIVLFVISPLSNYFVTSIVMKIISIVLLTYTMYLNFKQTEYLRNASQLNQSKEISSQLTINIICSYTFTLFVGLIIIFVIKTFF